MGPARQQPGAAGHSPRRSWRPPPLAPQTLPPSPRPAAASTAASASPPVAAAERQLAEALHRALRRPAGRLMLVLRLSALAPPAPHPHHRRIAESLLRDAAHLHDGQVFPLANNDVALLCRLPQGGDPGALAAALGHMFAAEAPVPAALVSLWHLDRDPAAATDYAAARLAAAPMPRPAATAATSADLLLAAGLQDTAANDGLPWPLRWQTGMALHAPDQASPAFRDARIALPAPLRRQAAIRRLAADLYLARHLFAPGERALLHRVAAAAPPGPPLQLCLGLDAVLAPGFAACIAAIRAAGTEPAVVLPLLDLCAAPALLPAVQSTLAAQEVPLILAGIDHLVLQLTAVSALRPAQLRLTWSPRLPLLPPADRAALAAALAAIGPARVVLDRTDGAAALRWGAAHGIRLFIGRAAEALHAAPPDVAPPGATPDARP